MIFLLVAVNLKFLLALWLSGFFVHERTWIRWMSVLFLLPWAVPSIPTIFSIRFMFNPEWGVINSTIFKLTLMDGPNWLNDPHIGLGLAMLTHIWKSLPFWTLILIAGRLAIPREQYEAASGRRRLGLAEVQVRDLAVAAHAVSELDHPVDDLVARRLQQRVPAHRRRARRTSRTCSPRSASATSASTRSTSRWRPSCAPCRWCCRWSIS